MRSGATSQKSFIQSLYARAIAVAYSGSSPSGPTCSTLSSPRTNSPRDGKSTAMSRPSASIAATCDSASQPAASDVGVHVVVLLAPAGLATVDVHRRARRPGAARVVLHLDAHVARDLRRARRRGVRVRRVDVALPEIRRLHHVQVAVADHVVTKAHRGNLTLAALGAATGYGARPGSGREPTQQGGRRCRSASSGWATSVGTSPPTWSTDGHDVVVFDVDAARAGDRRRRDAARRRWPTSARRAR